MVCAAFLPWQKKPPRNPALPSGTQTSKVGTVGGWLARPAGASGQNCSRIRASRWVSAREAAQMKGNWRTRSTRRRK